MDGTKDVLAGKYFRNKNFSYSADRKTVDSIRRKIYLDGYADGERSVMKHGVVPQIYMDETVRQNMELKKEVEELRGQIELRRLLAEYAEAVLREDYGGRSEAVSRIIGLFGRRG